MTERTGERILYFIAEYQKANSKPPTRRQIMQAVGLASTSGVQHWIDKYIESGQLEYIGERGDACNVRIPTNKTGE